MNITAPTKAGFIKKQGVTMLKPQQICKAVVLSLAALTCAALAAQSDGGKKRIGVATFENTSEFEGLGNRMADMLVSGLMQNRNYELIERAQLSKVLEEQGLGMTGLLEPSEAVQVGKIANLDYIVIGSIIEARADEKASIKSAVAGAIAGAAVSLADGRNSRRSSRIIVGNRTSAGQGIADATSGASYSTDFGISITVKVVEVETGTVLLTEDASAEDTRKWGKTQHVPSTEDFIKIAREAVRKVSNKIVWELDPLEPAVLLVEGDELTIDKGRKDGIAQGQRFVIIREGEPLYDLSGNLVGVKTIEIADIDILRAEATTAVGRILTVSKDPAAKKNYEVKRGDLAKIRFYDNDAAGVKPRRKR
jgi:curli biogenesis system outer membrane secretion channel CsgG